MYSSERLIRIDGEVIDISIEVPSAPRLLRGLDKSIRDGIKPGEIRTLTSSDSLTSQFIDILQKVCEDHSLSDEHAVIETLLENSSSLREGVAQMIYLNQKRHFNDGSWAVLQTLGSDIY